MNKQEAVKHLQNRLGHMVRGARFTWSLDDRSAASLLCMESTHTLSATLPQLIALRDALLAWKEYEGASAANNLINILSYNELMRDDQDGTEASPIISGGEVLYPQNVKSKDTIPF